MVPEVPGWKFQFRTRWMPWITKEVRKWRFRAVIGRKHMPDRIWTCFSIRSNPASHFYPAAKVEENSKREPLASVHAFRERQNETLRSVFAFSVSKEGFPAQNSHGRWKVSVLRELKKTKIVVKSGWVFDIVRETQYSCQKSSFVHLVELQVCDTLWTT